MESRIPAEKWSYEVWLADGQQLIGHVGETKEQIYCTLEPLDLGYRIRLQFNPKGKQTIRSCRLYAPTNTANEEWLLANGFQSWTESYWHRPTAEIPQLRKIARPLMGYYGDYHIDIVSRGPGIIHSWSWTERRQSTSDIELFASLNENTAFTCFHWRNDLNLLEVKIDCTGWEVGEPVILADFLVLQGNVNEVYDSWVEHLELPPLRAKLARGWTSWYQHYTSVSESIVEDNLDAFQVFGKQLDFFQIDDGFQTAVGDWLSIRNQFPSGMANMAKRIDATGATPGLWLAPAVADRRSDLLKRHPDWVQRDKHGKPLKAGYNPLWKGWFYALNTEHEGWLTYMQEVFETVVDDWGYGMLKLDFLYAACIYPTPELTRAQLMRRMLERIRSWSGEAYLLGCGTPLAPGFGIFDYCRIGADIHLRWEHRLLRWFRHRERVSTLVAMRSVLGRWPLAGRVWRNDPDVYLLREENMHMTTAERQLVHRTNALLGELLFTSDNPSTYGSFPKKEEEWQTKHWTEKNWVVTPEQDGDFKITSDKQTYRLSLGTTTGKWKEESVTNQE